MEPVGLIYEAYSEGQGSNGCQKSFISWTLVLNLNSSGRYRRLGCVY